MLVMMLHNVGQRSLSSTGPDRLVMVWVGCLLGGCHACMRYLQNGRGGEKEEDEGEEMEFWQAGEEESYSGQGRESGYSSTRTESSSPQHTTTTREEGGPASLTSQVKMLETQNTP